MDLTDRYLSAVGLLLPASSGSDIIDELRDVLMSRREAREETLGRSLTQAEDEALLKDFGHPLRVASRYGPQRALIGPELYPLYLFALRLVVAVVVVAAFVGAVASIAFAPGAADIALGRALHTAWSGGWAAFGVVTAVAAVIERTALKDRLLDSWAVTDLPSAAPRRRARRWFEQGWPDHVAGIVVQVIFLLWWIGLIRLWAPIIPTHAGQALHIGMGPVWTQLYWPVIALSLVAIAVHGARLLGGAAERAGYALDLAVQAANVGLALWLLRAGGWVSVSGSGMTDASLSAIRTGVDIGFRWAFICAAIGCAIAAGWDLWRLWRPRPAA